MKVGWVQLKLSLPTTFIHHMWGADRRPVANGSAKILRSNGLSQREEKLEGLLWRIPVSIPLIEDVVRPVDFLQSLFPTEGRSQRLIR